MTTTLGIQKKRSASWLSRGEKQKIARAYMRAYQEERENLDEGESIDTATCHRVAAETDGIEETSFYIDRSTAKYDMTNKNDDYCLKFVTCDGIQKITTIFEQSEVEAPKETTKQVTRMTIDLGKGAKQIFYVES